MNEESNNLPPLPTPPELLSSRGWYGTPTDGLLLDFSTPYSAPKWTLSHNGIPFAKRGDLHIIGGKAGHGKTAFMSQLMAAILCGRSGNMKCEIRDDEPTVLYIDTEMSIDDTIAIKNRVCALARIPNNVESCRFRVARLRDTTSADERYKQILQLMWEIKPTSVFIDGLLDIVNDYNEQKECSEIIRELMAFSTAMNMSMWCVLHENPTTDKLVGSLGSIAERKVTEVFLIRKHKAPHKEKEFKEFPSVFFEVKQTKARGRDQEDWYFTIEDQPQGWSLPVELGVDKEPEQKFDARKVQKWITRWQNYVTWPGAKSEIQKQIFNREGITSQDDVRELFQLCICQRFFIEQTPDEMKDGQKYPRLKLNKEIIMPF